MLGLGDLGIKQMRVRDQARGMETESWKWRMAVISWEPMRFLIKFCRGEGSRVQ